jgi:hypothetical protein
MLVSTTENPGAPAPAHGATSTPRPTLLRAEFADGCPVGTVALETANNNERLRGVCTEVFDAWQQAVTRSLATAGIPAEPAARPGPPVPARP